MIGEEVIAVYGDAGDGEELFEVQKLVRCKECIHYGRDSERNTYGCNLHSIGMTPSDFCSYGEREVGE